MINSREMFFHLNKYLGPSTRARRRLVVNLIFFLTPKAAYFDRGRLVTRLRFQMVVIRLTGYSFNPSICHIIFLLRTQPD